MNNRIDNEYLIDRRGRIIKYTGDANSTWSIHEAIALQLFPHLKDAYSHVAKLGWIIIGSDIYQGPVAYNEPSQSQINTLFDLGQLERLTIIK
jgi:hypothetical protein